MSGLSIDERISPRSVSKFGSVGANATQRNERIIRPGHHRRDKADRVLRRCKGALVRVVVTMP